jgi:hypothetical protein
MLKNWLFVVGVRIDLERYYSYPSAGLSLVQVWSLPELTVPHFF